MLEQYLAPCLQWMITPVANKLSRVSPNAITLAALLFGMIAAILIWQEYKLLAVLVLLLSGYLDMLDGAIARRYDKGTALGAVYDIIADRLVEVAIIISLYLLDPKLRATACIWVLCSILLCVTSFLVVAAVIDKGSHKGFYYSRGLIERAEAFMFFIAMVLLPQYFISIAYALSILVILTALLRILEFRKYVQNI